FSISHLEDGWRVQGRDIERVAAMTYWEFEATTRRFQQILDKMGISDALVKAGITAGDTVHIGEEVLEWSD
ncbi:MAG TPA: Obg family GTPase CgtA, partial [candidate division Zixibacteria bacterium]|nr:Obg family GTPase CgtA [candidate division Zixibacteria bacterium]